MQGWDLVMIEIWAGVTELCADRNGTAQSRSNSVQFRKISGSLKPGIVQFLSDLLRNVSNFLYKRS